MYFEIKVKIGTNYILETKSQAKLGLRIEFILGRKNHEEERQLASIAENMQINNQKAFNGWIMKFMNAFGSQRITSWKKIH